MLIINNFMYNKLMQIAYQVVKQWSNVSRGRIILLKFTWPLSVTPLVWREIIFFFFETSMVL